MTYRHGEAGGYAQPCALTENQAIAIIPILARTVGAPILIQDGGLLARPHEDQGMIDTTVRS